jgi:hypothetical protein
VTRRPVVGLRSCVPFLIGIVLAGLMAAAAFSLQLTLRGPTRVDALAVREIAELERIHSVRSEETLTWLPRVRARCVAHGRRDTLFLGDGRTLVVSESSVTRVGGLWRRPLLLEAEARLAACPRMLAGELAARLFAGKRVLDGMLLFDGTRAYRMRIDDEPPTVTLIVSRRSLRPLAVRFRTGRLTGASQLLRIRWRPRPRRSRAV